MTSATHRLFCFGLGYSAAALAGALRGEGWQIAGTCRSAERAGALAARGIDAQRFDRGHPLADAAAALAGATHVLVSVPPDEAGDPVLELHEADLAASETVEWVGYLSSTSVYGDRRGGWVDETSALAPRGARALARVAAEDAWLDLWHRYGLPVHLFRLAGIYGPGRSAIDQLRAGTAKRVEKPGHLFSRIHVDDIVQVLRASMARPNAGAIYNVCDDEPAPAAEVVEHASRLLGVAPPPLVPLEKAGLSPAALGFYAESRRVRNERIKRELGVTLRHPDYRRGLAACLTGGRPS
ncbi:MAG: NAD(P)-dependent oxidoreductase [Alphaproteobacteria bacterium]|nr:MAG: NAD(P)-dependent oxidoreductase [Alphaproteobacteria bacterium]